MKNLIISEKDWLALGHHTESEKLTRDKWHQSSTLDTLERVTPPNELKNVEDSYAMVVKDKHVIDALVMAFVIYEYGILRSALVQY